MTWQAFSSLHARGLFSLGRRYRVGDMLPLWASAARNQLTRLTLDEAVALASLAHPTTLMSVLRRLVRREPLSPIVCHACGAIGKMTLDAVGIENETPFERWRCCRCEGRQPIVFRKLS